MNHTTMGEGERSMQALLAKKNELGKKFLAVLMAVVLAVGVALPTGALSGVGEAWGVTNQNPNPSPETTPSYDGAFYWRFDSGVSGDGAGTTYTAAHSAYINRNSTSITAAEAEYNELAEHVRVTYKNTDGGTGTLYYGGVAAETSCGTAVTSGSEVKASDVGTEIYIETDEGYVVTSYMIGCEMVRDNGTYQYAEGCQTADTNNLEVVLSSDGQYKSSITITESEYVGESGEASFFGHRSEQDSNHHYALLITVVKVNVDLTVDKVADRETVSAGQKINYTVTANTTNNLVNPVFTDSFLVGNTGHGTTVSRINKQSGVETKLTAATSSSQITQATAESGLPAYYYVDTTNGKILLDGRWTPDYSIKVTYTYTVSSSIDASATPKITNTVWAEGTKTGTSSTVTDYGVASVDVIVNNPDKASLRVSKAFDGLTYDDVYGSLDSAGEVRSGGVLASFYMLLQGNDGSKYVMCMDEQAVPSDLSGYTFVQMKYSTDSTNDCYVFYGDLINVDPSVTFTVTEYGYWSTSLAGQYSACEEEFSWQVGEGSGATPASGNGSTVAGVTLTKGSTTFVSFTNTYSKTNSVVVSKVVKGNLGDRSAEFGFEAAYVYGGDTTALSAFSLSHGESITLTGIPIGATLYVKETTDYDVSVSEAVLVSEGTWAGWYSLEVTDATGLTITFTNSKNVLVDTGVSLDPVPFIVLLAGGLLGCLALAMRAAMKRKED